MALKNLKSPPSTLQTFIHSLLGLALAFILGVTLLITNLTQMASLLLLPFSRKIFREINRRCARSWWASCVLYLKYIHGVQLKVSGDFIPARENALVIVNHQGMTDVFPLLMLAYQKDSLGDLKWFVKDVIKYIPGIGWGMLFLDCLFVKRSWNQDQKNIQKTFARFKTNQIPLWLISFVEGTRITPEKLKKSQIYSQKQGLPVLKNCMIPKTKGFVASVHGLSTSISAIYDVTLIYRQGVPSVFQLIFGQFKEFEIHIKRSLVRDLPSDSKDLSQWLIDRYVEKDHLISTLSSDPLIRHSSQS